MKKSRDINRHRSKAGSVADVLVLVLLFVAALGVRWWYAEAVVFPPTDKSAFYSTTAENIVTGRGLEVDVLWSYQPSFPSATHPSHERWMPMTTGLVAAAFQIHRTLSGTLDTSLRIAQVPGLILGALLAPLTYLVGRRSLPGGTRTPSNSRPGSRWVSLSAALLVALNATLCYQSASVDSSAPFVLLSAWALTLAVREPSDQGGYLAAGMLVALAYLTYAGGLLLLVAIPLAWYLLPSPQRPLAELPDNPAAELVWRHWPRDRSREDEQQRALGPRLVNVLDLGVAFALVVSPWLLRNYLVFGTPVPSPMLSQAWLTDLVDNFNYWSPPTWQTWLAQSWSVLLDQRVQALRHNGQVLLQSTFAWGLLALPGLWLLRRKWSFFTPLVYGLLLFLGLALVFPVSSMSGAFYHSLGAVMPFLALAAIYSLQRASQSLGRHRKLASSISAAVVIALLVLTGARSIQVLPAVTMQHQANKEKYETVAGWLAQHAAPKDAIVTTQTYTLNYVTGRPCIALPGNESPDAAWEAAQRYGARYLVITQVFGDYPQILHDQPDPRFRLVEATETTQIYEILSY